MQSLRRTILTFSALLLASGVSAACERMSAPPCPRRALALDRRGTLADQATAARYFPSLATHKVYDGREGVGELLLFGERPLSDLAVKGAYRVIETGPLGHVAVLEHRASETVARWKRWSLCDDHNEFGAALELNERPVAPEVWAQVDACMDAAFWNGEPAEPVEGRFDCVLTWMRACGPGRHEAGCVVVRTDSTTYVEGIRDGVHHVVIRPGFLDESDPRETALARCVRLMTEAVHPG